MEENESIGQKLKRIREEKGLTLTQVLEATGIAVNYLDRLEQGVFQKQSANVLYKLAGLYEIDLKPLLIEAGIIIQNK